MSETTERLAGRLVRELRARGIKLDDAAAAMVRRVVTEELAVPAWASAAFRRGLMPEPEGDT